MQNFLQRDTGNTYRMDGNKWYRLRSCLYFAALTSSSLLNDSYNYRTFHTAILEKFPFIGFKTGFDWAEALYNAIVSERGNDYNLSLSEKAVQTGKEQAKLISIRLRTLLSPNVY